MRQYLDLLRLVYERGELKGSRAVLESTGTKPKTRSLFGYQNRYDLTQGFPLVTTKTVPFRQVVVEVLWFLSGSTNVDYLQRHNVKIWDQWADETGELGPIYGKQWRAWEGGDGQHVDQVAELLRGIEQVKADPTASAARRLILTAWNPADLPKIHGPSGCHTLCQFSMNNGKLSCQLYQRSADLFLGVPWNIASYALLTHLIAKVTGLEAAEFIHTFGDAHIYENHLDQVGEQLTREPYPLPKLEIDDSVTSLDGLTPEQFRLVGYRHHARLSGEVAV
ncbi:thymidylate synthase [Singulisphaera acidiphila]|uniref:Thymidylate synthase n=1 Tax=Singulisphaera acidiphila (strain ATCC BAA-1392 / DSM 18658 / VKM B-2454 / MOB10) TaxID=886293 RepID=L0DG57_SINAD|nr:thymidylate synthase [Singulisphaera acidiphila]AGA27830.1 thymidylate synthase [Singulisphaera acidiphila DSM 18658]